MPSPAMEYQYSKIQPNVKDFVNLFCAVAAPRTALSKDIASNMPVKLNGVIMIKELLFLKIFIILYL
jgi:hypothetical protein